MHGARPEHPVTVARAARTKKGAPSTRMTRRPLARGDRCLTLAPPAARVPRRDHLVVVPRRCGRCFSSREERALTLPRVVFAVPTTDYT